MPNQSKELWDRIRKRLFGPDGLFSIRPEELGIYAKCADDIESVLAEKDKRIAELTGIAAGLEDLNMRKDNDIALLKTENNAFHFERQLLRHILKVQGMDFNEESLIDAANRVMKNQNEQTK